MTDFNGRPVLVTGASGGIGGATVRHLVEAGADVIASGRSKEEALEALAADTGAGILPFDVTSEESVRHALDGLDIWESSTALATAARLRPRWRPILRSSTR